MRFNTHAARSFVLTAMAVLVLAGCTAGSSSGSDSADSATVGLASKQPGASVSWKAELDPDAQFLNVAGEEGAAMPGDCWVLLENGAVQMQVSGSSIPQPEVEDVDYSDGVLTVTMREPADDEPATMDYVLHQFMLTPTDDSQVKSVVLVQGDTRAELPMGVLANDAPAA
ncbi:MAG: hypothetical protein Q4B77_03405 [Coriobacteriaceae bacterium]|nr:hypothetical protein [Coriobacteriaceae bacterium]